MDEPIVAQFPMTHAQDYQLHLPHMGRSPELEHDALAFVVAFAGPIEMGVMRAPDPIDANGNPVPGAPRSNELNGVVCVVVNGSPTYYSGVDITGWN